MHVGAVSAMCEEQKIAHNRMWITCALRSGESKDRKYSYFSGLLDDALIELSFLRASLACFALRALPNQEAKSPHWVFLRKALNYDSFSSTISCIPVCCSRYGKLWPMQVRFKHPNSYTVSQMIFLSSADMSMMKSLLQIQPPVLYVYASSLPENLVTIIISVLTIRTRFISRKRAGSCKMGDNRSGRCWDRVGVRRYQGKPPMPWCQSRWCRAGWTCSCHKRTHLCKVTTRRAYVPARLGDGKNPQAECATRRVLVAERPVLMLGSMLLALSPSGISADACSQIAVFHNGRLIANFGRDPNTARSRPSLLQRQRAFHDRLELRAGDVLAWRFVDASYYCFLHRVALRVNSFALSETSPGGYLLYARAASPGWFSRNIDLTGRIANSEKDRDLTKWLRPRSRMLATPRRVTPGVDFWSPPDQSNPDNRISNYYWRFQIPNELSRKR